MLPCKFFDLTFHVGVLKVECCAFADDLKLPILLYYLVITIMSGCFYRRRLIWWHIGLCTLEPSYDREDYSKSAHYTCFPCAS
ncbi:hypothetical protein Y032_0658g1254 [Ancylostoma ceylanicum]|uniref:Uncharacterized protein n=1 Tax=Ancylostoma ceylanicum TaxID=53326 RepID=A0A016WHU2_9BILA|nr:hypothetical protein Y032_0658g1254 [Ancylostoma ceylanicum]